MLGSALCTILPIGRSNRSHSGSNQLVPRYRQSITRSADLWSELLGENLQAEDRVLIVDDVYDTGRTIVSIIESMQDRLKLNMPEQVRVAVPFYKPARNQTDREPEYFLYQSDEWLVYPHSAEGLSPQEILEHKPEIAILAAHL